MHAYIHTCIHMYIYIYMYRERDIKYVCGACRHESGAATVGLA